MKCPKCQTELPETSKFCLECGHAITQENKDLHSDSLPEAERKRVTALFSDLSGYTAMSEKLDPEDVGQITGRIFDGIKSIIKKYEGSIEHFAGDGVLALFGFPRAHEDDPIRAIRAAQEIHGFVEALSPQYEAKIGRSLSMHSGINTGLAVSGEADAQTGNHSITGDAINVASRLSDLAEAGEILVGPDTHKTTQTYFKFESLKPTRVKGKSEPIQIYKLVSEKASKPQLMANRQVSSVMVGRDRELSKLELQVMKAVNGKGSVVNVIGEAGIGKSRLIAELKQREVMKGVMLLEGRAISIGKNLSFHPIIDLLKQWASIREDDTEIQAVDKLEQTITAIDPQETDEILPFVATLMGLKLRGRHAKRVEGIEGEALEKLILKNFRVLMIKGSELRPMVIVIEDLHWADNSSLELLQSLYGLSDTHRLLFVNVFRPGYLEEDVTKAIAGAHERIDILPLETRAGETLIDNMLDIKGLPYSIKEQILTRAGGNPFFIEEVVRSFIDDGTVIRGPRGFEVTHKIDHVVIPPTINDVLMARIDRLEEQTKELIKIASVIGRSFFDRIIKEVADSIDSVDDRLAYLKDVQFIRDRRRMEELEYLFKHALAQEAAYESTLIQQRKALHLKVARSIEKIFHERLHEFYGMLAHHYILAGDADKAEEYLTRAGEEALKSSASSEALNYFKDALKLFNSKHADVADPEELAIFEKSIALALYNRGQYADAVTYFDTVLKRWGKRTTRGKFSVHLGVFVDLLRLTLCLYLPIKKSKRRPIERDLDILDIKYKNVGSLVYVNPMRMFADGIKAIRESLKLELTGTDIGFESMVAGTGIFSITGMYKLSKKCLDLAERSRNRDNIRHLMVFNSNENMHNILQGNWTKINEIDESLIDQNLRLGNLWDTSVYLWWYGMVRIYQGYIDKVDNTIEKCEQIWNDFSYENVKIFSYHLQVNLMLQLRRLEQAKELNKEAIRFANQTNYLEPEIYELGVMAIINILLKNRGEARKSLLEAKALVLGQKLVPNCFVESYLFGKFYYDVTSLEGKAISNDGSAVLGLRRTAHNSGKAAKKCFTKYAVDRVAFYRIMGKYYWFIDKQHKALKWWDKAIREGERLGARPDLSRTYFEVGKSLLDPKSKHKKLNGIGAREYLEKAHTLFEEMGLERDLEELEPILQGA